MHKLEGVGQRQAWELGLDDSRPRPAGAAVATGRRLFHRVPEAIAFTMCSASLPTPGRNPDDIEYRKKSPTKYNPGSLVSTPRRWIGSIGSSSSPKTARSIQEKSGRN